MHTGLTALKVQLDALAKALDGGYAEVRTGEMPDSTQRPATGTLLGCPRFGRPAFAEAVPDGDDAVIVARPTIDDEDAAEDGEAGWVRVYSHGGDVMFDCSITAPGGGGGATMEQRSIQKHGRVRLGAVRYKLPM